MKASDNKFPGIILNEAANDGSDFSNPDADYRRLFLGEDGALHLKDSAGAVTAIGGGSVATDAIWDAKGDLAVGTGANTAQKLTVGATNGHVLTIDSGETTGLKWAAAGAGSSRAYLDTYSDPLDGTMGDDFTESSLNARWSRLTITSGWETYQLGDSTWLQAAIGSATQACQYEQTCPSGDWEFIASFKFARTHSNPAMYGLIVKDSSGNGRGMVFYTDANAYIATIASDIYSTYTTVWGGEGYAWYSGAKTWARLRKSGSTIYGSFSYDGEVWGPESSVSDSSTWAKVAVGRVLGTNASQEWFMIDRFDRVA